MVKIRFEINLLPLRYKKIQLYWNKLKIIFFSGAEGGHVHKQGPQSFQFRVDSVKDLIAVRDHFDKYPLISSAAEQNSQITSFLSKDLI